MLDNKINFFIDENTKIAIAVLFTNLINADGIVYESELRYLEKVKHKYGLTISHFRKSNSMSLATAINQIIATAKAIEKRSHQSLYTLLYSDMLEIAGVDRSVSPDEAMICLALRYAYDFQDAHIFEYEHKSIKLAKKEIIYIDDGQSARIECLQKESKDYYDNINSILNLYGFTYINIPTIQEQLMTYPKEFLGNIIEYLYPEKATEDVVDVLSAKLTAPNCVSIFGCQIMQEGAKMKVFPPSLLFKINESTIVTSKDNTKHIVFNLLQLPIKDGYQIQDTIQNFIRKYRELVSLVQVCKIFDDDTKFNIRSFQRTLIDFYFALNQEVNVLIVKVNKKGKQKCFLKFGELKEVGIPQRMLSYYLLILYLCKTGKPLLKGCETYKNTSDWQLHKEIYGVISNELDNLTEFDSNLNNEHGKIRDRIKSVIADKKNWELYIPIRNQRTKEFSIGMDIPVFIEIDDNRYELIAWIDMLLATAKK